MVFLLYVATNVDLTKAERLCVQRKIGTPLNFSTAHAQDSFAHTQETGFRIPPSAIRRRRFANVKWT
jgi:hypothetical protein